MKTEKFYEIETHKGCGGLILVDGEECDYCQKCNKCIRLGETEKIKVFPETTLNHIRNILIAKTCKYCCFKVENIFKEILGEK